MSYTTAQARERILRELGLAASQIGLALDYLSEAYEQVDANLADQLEETLFAPVQAAYARARRTATEFVSRHALAERDGSLPAAPSRPHGPAALIEAASHAVERADQWIGELQDSMLPVEVGDEALRAGLADTRSLLSALPTRARELVRILGR
ncbi:MAG: hypothetical protein JO153_04400 [Solirubrobacterales bacterium]|nr:hypothetical protein [Solirubrobacterales bacterium]MBV9915722.1 hypothetical protein [Solirubrobacterales bacterium]